MVFNIPFFFLGFLVGALFGSFAALLIMRLPLKEDFIFKFSRCDTCKKPILPYWNIPIISFVMLRGVTRCCRHGIPKIHFFSELILALAGGFIFAFLPLKEAIGLFFIVFYLYTISIIDFYHFIIPDVLSLSFFPVSFLISIFLFGNNYLYALIGFLIGFGFFYVVALFYEKIRGKMGLGGGDIKLMGALGPLLGYEGVMFTILCSSILGSIVGLVSIMFFRKSKEMRLPYGPFIAFSALIYILYMVWMGRPLDAKST